jgi:signal transduction histidine kinase
VPPRAIDYRTPEAAPPASYPSGRFTHPAAPAAERLAAPAELAQPATPSPGPSRLEQLGRLTASVAHDFNNLLSVILVCSGEIADAATDPAQRARAEEIREAAERGAALSRRLLAADRVEEPVAEPIAVDVSIINAAGLLRRTLGNRIELSLTSDGHVPAISLVPGELERILLNLATNARDALVDGGSVSIRSGLVLIPPGDPVLAAGWYVRIAVADDGIGMTPEVARQAMLPYFSTKPEGEGTGLGLATVQGLARAARGDLRISTAPGEGTTVSVYLPSPNTRGQSIGRAAA